MCDYSATYDDANKTLEMEPHNIKALFRRGLALQHLNRFQEALTDMNEISTKEPKHMLSKKIAKELKEQIQSKQKSDSHQYSNLSRSPSAKIVDPVPSTSYGRTNMARHCSARVVDLNGDPVPSTSYGRTNMSRQPSARIFDQNGDPVPSTSYGLTNMARHCSARIVDLNGDPVPSTSYGRTNMARQPSARLFDRNGDPVPSTSYGHTNMARKPSARIIDLNDDPVPSTRSTKMKIVEVDASDEVENFYKSNKCVVVDKRTQKTV